MSALSLHGAVYLAMKTQGDLEARSKRFATRAWLATIVLSAVGMPATILARPASLTDYLRHPIAFVFPVMAAACLVTIRIALNRRLQFWCFLASCGYLSSMFLGAAFGLFPVLLPSVGTEGRDLTVNAALSGPHTLQVGLAWWSVGMCLAVFYFCVVYWLFRGKVPVDDAGYDH